ncbi:MAG: glycosyltransferase [Flavobacteriales bacterium]
MKPDIRIAIVVPSRPDRRETFAAAHVAGLSEVVLVLTGGVLPTHDDAGHSLLSTTRFGRLERRFRSTLLGQDKKAQLRQRIARRLREAKVDVVLAEFGNTGAEMLPSCEAAGIPLVPYFLGFDAYREDQLAMYANYERLFAGARTIVSVSKSMIEHLVRIGAPRGRLVYNSCGADVDHFALARAESAPPHFLAVGRFVDKKAPHLTLLAFERAVRQRPNARLTMVGDGELWNACAQLVKALGLGEQVDLCGPRSAVQIAELLKGSRAFVQHSLVTSTNDHEGTPVAILEAMASGIPIISTRHADIPEVVADGERGLLCDEGDIDAMASNMVRLIDEPDLAGRMGRAGRAYVVAHHRVQDRIAELQRILISAARAGTS